MTRTSPAIPAVVLLGVIAAMTAGCATSWRQQAYRLHQKMAFKVGDSWVIKPPRELNATRIELSRQALDAAEDAPAAKLDVDLIDGRAAFHDADGRTYPHQVRLQTARQISAFMTDRTWQVANIGADRKAAGAANYCLAVYEGETQLKPVATWGAPSAKKLPDVLVLLIDTFNEAERYAHPLSKNVDLLE